MNRDIGGIIKRLMILVDASPILDTIVNAFSDAVEQCLIKNTKHGFEIDDTGLWTTCAGVVYVNAFHQTPVYILFSRIFTIVMKYVGNSVMWNEHRFKTSIRSRNDGIELCIR